MPVLRRLGDGESGAVRGGGRSIVSDEVLAERHHVDKTGGTRNLLDTPRRRFEEVARLVQSAGENPTGRCAASGLFESAGEMPDAHVGVRGERLHIQRLIEMCQRPVQRLTK